jgi:hypothetical protein
MLSRSTFLGKEYFAALGDTIAAQIAFDIEQIDQLFSAYAQLLKHAEQQTPDLVELTAIASVVHSFYNGLENIFLSIAKRLDQQVPAGTQSHRDLLIRMTRETPNRGSVISVALSEQLSAYLAFRHFYRHSYSFFLQWSELEKLVTPILATWAHTKAELYTFLDSLSDNNEHGTSTI